MHAHVDNDLGPYVVGERYRASDPGVKTNPQYFVLAGTPKSEWPSPFAAVQQAIDAAEEAARVERERRRGPEIPLDDTVEATTTFTHRGRPVVQGQWLRRDDPLVKEVAKDHADWFQRPARPLV